MLFTLVVLGSVLMFLVKTVNNKLNNPQDTSLDLDDNNTQPQDDDPQEPVIVSDNTQSFEPEPAASVNTPTQQETTEQQVTTRQESPVKSYSSFGHLYGLIGRPLGHSTSKSRFNKMFNEQHINAFYENYELESIEQVKELVANNPNLCGFNVTIPFKEDIIPFLDRLDETAQAIGAVNTVKVIHNQSGTKLVGYNTDWIGFTESFKELLDGRRKALILGTGGVSKAVKYALDKLGIESKFVSRNSTFDILGYYELSPSIMDDYEVIVNCTPLGMWPKTDLCPDIPYTFLSENHVLLDVIANPDETLFMKKGREHGVTAKGGKDMLEQQAVAAWNIWNRIGE